MPSRSGSSRTVRFRFAALVLSAVVLQASASGCGSRSASAHIKANEVPPNSRAAALHLRAPTRGPSALTEATPTPTPSPAMSMHGDDTDVLKAVRVHMVFWGAAWAATPTPAPTPPIQPQPAPVTKAQATAAIRSIVRDGQYFDALTEYSAKIGRPSSVDFVDVASAPAASEPPTLAVPRSGRCSRIRRSRARRTATTTCTFSCCLWDLRRTGEGHTMQAPQPRSTMPMSTSRSRSSRRTVTTSRTFPIQSRTS
jgi:hypothetical protein